MNNCKQCDWHGIEIVYNNICVKAQCANCGRSTNWHNTLDDRTCAFDAVEGAKLEWDRDNQPPEPRRKQV